MPALHGWGAPQPSAFYPLDLNRIIELTFSLFRFRWRVFVGIALVILTPVSVVQGLLQVVTADAIARSTRDMMQAIRIGTADPATILALFPWAAILLSYAVSIVVLLISSLVVAAITHATAGSFIGGAVSIRGSLGAAANRFAALAVVFLVPFLLILGVVLVAGSLVVLLFLANITNGTLQPGLPVFIAIVGAVALVAVLIFVGIRWAFAVPAVMVEGMGGLQALGRSWRLVSGSGWRVLGFLVLFAVLIGLPAGVIGYVITAVVGSGVYETSTGLVSEPFQAFLSTFLIGVIFALFAPFTTIAVTILYFDLRARHGESAPVPGQPIPAPSGESPG
jgi:hypothetical protein